MVCLYDFIYDRFFDGCLRYSLPDHGIARVFFVQASFGVRDIVYMVMYTRPPQASVLRTNCSLASITKLQVHPHLKPQHSSKKKKKKASRLGWERKHASRFSGNMFSRRVFLYGAKTMSRVELNPGAHGGCSTSVRYSLSQRTK